MTHWPDSPSNCEQNGLSSAYWKSLNNRDVQKTVAIVAKMTLWLRNGWHERVKWTFPWHLRQLRIWNELVEAGQVGFEFKVIERSFWMIKFWRWSVKTFVIGGRRIVPNFFNVFTSSRLSSSSSININQWSSCQKLVKQSHIYNHLING